MQVSDEVSEETAKVLDPQYTITGEKMKRFVIVDKIDLPVTINLSGKLGVYPIQNVEKLDEIETAVVRVSKHMTGSYCHQKLFFLCSKKVVNFGRNWKNNINGKIDKETLK